MLYCFIPHMPMWPFLNLDLRVNEWQVSTSTHKQRQIWSRSWDQLNRDVSEGWWQHHKPSVTYNEADECPAQGCVLLEGSQTDSATPDNRQCANWTGLPDEVKNVLIKMYSNLRTQRRAIDCGPFRNSSDRNRLRGWSTPPPSTHTSSPKR